MEMRQVLKRDELKFSRTEKSYMSSLINMPHHSAKRLKRQNLTVKHNTLKIQNIKDEENKL